MAGIHAVDAHTEALLEQTRRRAGRINRYVDMIPARFYLSSEALQAHRPRSSLDPAQYKPTSQLLVELLTGSTGASVGSSSATSTKKKKAKKPNYPGDAEVPTSRDDLRGLLERRIAELKEERRRKQSTKDREKNLSAKAANTSKRSRVDASADLPAKKQRSLGASSIGHEDVEAGRLSFEPKIADLPFEAGVNQRGTKVRQLRSALRKEEGKQRKLEEAGENGEREELRKGYALDVALRRARGEKVHDDVTRLRKAQKQLEVKKVKGKEKWDARVQTNIKQAEDKQQQRKENLQNRRGGKNKGNKGRAGFEGKKSGYLNED